MPMLRQGSAQPSGRKRVIGCQKAPTLEILPDQSVGLPARGGLLAPLFPRLVNRVFKGGQAQVSAARTAASRCREPRTFG
jgi:hypothetical protein